MIQGGNETTPRGRAMALARGSLTATWGWTLLTAAGFVVLSRLHVSGGLPLWVPMGLLVVSSLMGELGGRRWGKDPTAAQLHVLVAVHVLTVSVITYAIGWGAILAVGYLVIVARDLEDFGSRVTRPALVWTIGATVLGQAAVQAGVVHSYVRPPGVHGVAALECLGVAVVVYILGSETAARERDEAALVAGEASFRRLFADNPQPMWVFDAETWRFLEVNGAAVAHYGYSRDEFLARTIADIRPAEDVPRLHLDVQTQQQGVRHGSWRHRLADGRLIDVEVSSHALTFGGRPAVLVTVQDVTQRTALEQELRHQAFHDSLTNLANRALFLDRAGHALRRVERATTGVAVLILDLDGFKTVNDSLGHAAGDALLVAAAARLQTALRTTDTAARLGGDEFAVLVEDATDPEEAMTVAERVLEALLRPFTVAGKELFVHASIGVAWTAGEEDADELVRDADAAMYRAKAEGKGCARLFEPAMHTASLARLELETDLRRAVAAGEFVLHYQPVVCAPTAQITGFEALVRWQHPVQGLVEPEAFIPLAEENGLIVDIGRWVLTEACRQARTWQLHHHDDTLSVAVNLSARQLADAGLVHDVARAIAGSGLAPHCLTLEITESVLIADPEAAVARLRQLKAFGVRLAIDDFGTGYSSLSSLQHLPVDALKIDKTFIDGVAGGAEATGLVEAIMRMATTLALETIAEGVERPEQLESLQALGCAQIQGFYFSRPLVAEDVGALLGRGKAFRPTGVLPAVSES
jgi:diguanylate cyclase (GGDEF)-like protein/PAS domain S-box-containing protein